MGFQLTTKKYLDCSNIMSAKPKLIYFNFRGRGELPRWILTQGKGCHGFEDCRISFEEWPALKPKTVLGFLPQLEMGDCKLSQYGAVCRTLAKMCKLDGSCPEECAQADMINECAKDVMDAFYNCHSEKNECMKKGMMCKFMDETVPKFCERMTCLLKKNGGKYFVGDCLTYADLAVACTLDSLCLNFPNADMTKCMQKYKELCCHHSMVCGLPAIKEHCAKRPSTPL